MQRHKSVRRIEEDAGKSALRAREFHQMKDDHSPHHYLVRKLKRNGASNKLANFISRLHCDLTLVSSGKRIDVKNGEVWMFDKDQPVAVMGVLKRKGAFIYDSRLFDEYMHIARAVFSELFLIDYQRMITRQGILTPRELRIAKKLPKMLLPEFHYFVVRMNVNAKVMEIGLFANDNSAIAMLTDPRKDYAIPPHKEKIMESMGTPS
jgi:hypothetical protein